MRGCHDARMVDDYDIDDTPSDAMYASFLDAEVRDPPIETMNEPATSKRKKKKIQTDRCIAS